jgi:hypothetical protein
LFSTKLHNHNGVFRLSSFGVNKLHWLD